MDTWESPWHPLPMLSHLYHGPITRLSHRLTPQNSAMGLVSAAGGASEQLETGLHGDGCRGLQVTAGLPGRSPETLSRVG